jgi:nucleolar protein 14
LTHLGRSLSTFADFDGHDPRLDEEGDIGDAIKEDHVHAMHFGGFDDDPSNIEEKSYAEKMQEMITKSKMHKMERQKAKEENELLRQDLNNEFSDLKSLLFSSNSGISEASTAIADDYDKIVKELAFEKKAKPTDRLKTEQEIMIEQAAQLQTLEQQRINRMFGLNSDSDGEKDIEIPTNPDSIDISDKGTVPYKKNSTYPAVNRGALLNVAIKSICNDKILTKPPNYFRDDNELPFTFAFPDSYEDFAMLLQNRPLTDQLAILQRIRILYHPSLAEGNHRKLQDLLRYLCRYFESICQSDTSYQSRFINLDSFYSQISELSANYPQTISEIALDRLQHFQLTGVDSIFNPQELMMVVLFSRLFPSSDFHHVIMTPVFLLVSKWLHSLTVRVLILKKSFTSSSAELKSRFIRHTCSGIFLCQLILEWQKESCRFFPEPLVFLSAVCGDYSESFFLSVTDDVVLDVDFSGGKIPLMDLLYSDQSREKDCANILRRINGIALETYAAFSRLFALKESLDAEKSCKIAYSNSQSIEGSILTHSISTWGWPEIFSHFNHMLDRGLENEMKPRAADYLLPTAYNMYKNRLNSIQNYAPGSRSKLPLQWQRRKPVPIRMFAPKFEESYNLDRHYDADRDRSEKRKISVLHKREMKGAIRELRKDSAFLANEKHHMQRNKDKEYQSKIKRVYGILGAEQGEKNREKRMRSE